MPLPCGLDDPRPHTRGVQGEVLSPTVSGRDDLDVIVGVPQRQSATVGVGGVVLWWRTLNPAVWSFARAVAPTVMAAGEEAGMKPHASMLSFGSSPGSHAHTPGREPHGSKHIVPAASAAAGSE